MVTKLNANPEAKLPDLDELLTETGAAAFRAGVRTKADVEQVIDDVRREMGASESREALRALGRQKRAGKPKPQPTRAAPQSVKAQTA